MAVKKLKAKRQAQFVMPMVQQQLILPLLMTIVGKDKFVGALGDTVNFKIPSGSIAVARDYDFRGRTGPIVLDDIYQTGGNLPIKLNTHVVSATGLEDEHFTLDDITFASDVLAPQVAAVVEDIEAKALSAINNTPNIKHTVPFDDTSTPTWWPSRASACWTSRRWLPPPAESSWSGSTSGPRSSPPTA